MHNAGTDGTAGAQRSRVCTHSHTRAEEGRKHSRHGFLGRAASGRSHRMRASLRQISRAMPDSLLTGGSCDGDASSCTFPEIRELAWPTSAGLFLRRRELTQGTNPCPHALASSSRPACQQLPASLPFVSLWPRLLSNIPVLQCDGITTVLSTRHLTLVLHSLIVRGS
jgi:hypothetical protein